MASVGFCGFLYLFELVACTLMLVIHTSSDSDRDKLMLVCWLSDLAHVYAQNVMFYVQLSKMLYCSRG